MAAFVACGMEEAVSGADVRLGRARRCDTGLSRFLFERTGVAVRVVVRRLREH